MKRFGESAVVSILEELGFGLVSNEKNLLLQEKHSRGSSSRTLRNTEASVEFARRALRCEPEQLGSSPAPCTRSRNHSARRASHRRGRSVRRETARYRRIALARDLYDLAQLAQRSIDETLVRRLWVIKVWGDVVDDNPDRNRSTQTTSSDAVPKPTIDLSRSAP